MEFTFKGKQFSFPASLNEIKLEQRIAFYTEHGKALDEHAAKVDAVTDEFDKEIEMSLWHLEMAYRTFSFYSGIPLDALKTEADIADMMDIYNTIIQPLFDQERNITLLQSYDFNGEKWSLSAPELLPDSKMTLNEFVYPMEITRQFHAVGQGKWNHMPYICACYLRKENEAFTEDLLQETGERIKLMGQLPLDIALAVGFFLTSSLNIYSKILASSNEEDQKESTPLSTSISGGG